MRKSIQILRCAEKVVEEAVKEVKKEGRLKRIGNYIKNIIDDYKTVAIEIGQDMKERPVKSSVYVSLITSAVVLFKTNPKEAEFHTRLTECISDLMLCGDLIRNPSSNKSVDYLSKLNNDHRLCYYNLGLCSIMCVTECGPEVGLYSAKCKHLKPHWTEFHKSIVDVGVLGKWRYLEKAMKDYDVNAEEWLEDGRPNKQFRFYQNNPLVSWDMKVSK